MRNSTQALVNPTVLIWARQESGYLPEPVAKRLNVKLERLLAWERGDLKPTVRQAQVAFRGSYSRSTDKSAASVQERGNHL